jgi:hypothetical protein
MLEQLSERLQECYRRATKPTSKKIECAGLVRLLAREQPERCSKGKP